MNLPLIENPLKKERFSGLFRIIDKTGSRGLVPERSSVGPIQKTLLNTKDFPYEGSPLYRRRDLNSYTIARNRF